tara:strand:- start:148 stop:720 length:573 start_codon:yes stop_codon:yes gene_type:complete
MNIQEQPIDSNDERITIVCPLCDKRELNVFQKEKELMQCINCGYSTNGDYKYEGHKTNNQFYKNLDPAMKRWALDANDYIWLPSILTFDSGLLYPYEGTDDTMIWAFAPAIQIPETEQHKFPREDGEGNYSARYDIENQVTFDSFSQAIFEINLILEARRKALDETDKSPEVNLPELKKYDKNASDEVQS